MSQKSYLFYIDVPGRCSFLGAFTELLKAAINFVMSVCPSRMEQFGSQSTDFRVI